MEMECLHIPQAQVNKTRPIFFSAQLMGGGVFVVFLGLAVSLDLPHFLIGFIQTRQDMCSALPIW
jgi:hypothetical protein